MAVRPLIDQVAVITVTPSLDVSPGSLKRLFRVFGLTKGTAVPDVDISSFPATAIYDPGQSLSRKGRSQTPPPPPAFPTSVLHQTLKHTLCIHWSLALRLIHPLLPSLRLLSSHSVHPNSPLSPSLPPRSVSLFHGSPLTLPDPIDATLHSIGEGRDQWGVRD